MLSNGSNHIGSNQGRSIKISVNLSKTLDEFKLETMSAGLISLEYIMFYMKMELDCMLSRNKIV